MPSGTKCWDCKRVGTGTCSWDRSRGNTPTPGWTAIPTTLLAVGKKLRSYHVIDCPLFVPDDPRVVLAGEGEADG